MFKILKFCFLFSFPFLNICNSNDEFCNLEENSCSELNFKEKRFILYDVNPPEGFNLRRDVYMRYAVFAHELMNSNEANLKSFNLVLPPWSNMYHWKHKDIPEYLPWAHFFDLESLQKFAPVIEMYQFFNEIKPQYSNKIKIDEVYILQHFKDMFETGNFEERMSIEDCEKEIATSFFYYDNITSNNIRCLSFHGHVANLKKILKTSKSSTFLFDHAEVALHDRYGDATYWKARRSMRFNKDLREIANDFRKKFLNSTDEQDRIVLPDDWRLEKPKRNAKGGPYLAVHLRRRDFVWSRRKEVPSLEGAAKQIKILLDKFELKTVFIATDAPEKEFTELKLLLPDHKVFKFNPNSSIKKKFKDGGTAIVEQIICSHAQFFIGTFESTFSFRIQEEREILGFPVETTFNRLCGDDNVKCERPSIWKIVY